MTNEKSATPGMKGFMARHYGKIHIAAVAVMCLMVVMGINFAVKFEILRDVFAAVNTMIDIVLMAFLVMLFAFSSSNKYAGNRQNLSFSLLIGVDFVMLFCSMVGYAAYGLADEAELIRIMTSLSYMLCFISFAVLWKYQKFFYKKTTAVKVSSYILYLSVLFYTVLSVMNIFAPILFRIDAGGYYDSGYLDFITVVMLILVVVILYVNVLIADCDVKKKTALASYGVAPAVIVILDILSGATHSGIYLPSVIDVLFLFPLYIIFYSIYMEQKNEIERSEAEQMKMETSLMLSQIQPHFLYNCLSSIAVLCEDDPPLAEKATTTFADYLRENMNCIGAETPIPFTEEMRHVERYVWLEKLRFGDRASVVYDLQSTDFSLPALTVQPLVENAIKHGICKATHPGTVTISSFEDGKAYRITIADDGVGFDPAEHLNDGRQHIGIESVRKRLNGMVGGSVRIETAPEKGTTVTITIPKNGGEK